MNYDEVERLTPEQRQELTEKAALAKKRRRLADEEYLLDRKYGQGGSKHDTVPHKVTNKTIIQNLLRVLRWLALLPSSVGAFLVSYTLAYWLLRMYTDFFLPKGLQFMLAWPNSFIGSCALVLTAFAVAPHAKVVAASTVFCLSTIAYGWYMAAALHGHVHGILPIQTVFEAIGGVLGGGYCVFRLIRTHSRKGYARFNVIGDESILPRLSSLRRTEQRPTGNG